MRDNYKILHELCVEDPTVLSVIRKMEKRSEEGMHHYGISIRDNKKEIVEWLVDIQEEVLDTAIYIEKLIEELNKELQNQEEEGRQECHQKQDIFKIMARLVSWRKK